MDRRQTPVGKARSESTCFSPEQRRKRLTRSCHPPRPVFDLRSPEPWLSLCLLRRGERAPERTHTMTQVSTSDGKLIIDVQGWDKLWSLKSRLEIPLEHISGVRTAADERVGGIRAPGTYIPGVITAGTFLQEGSWVFWDVHDPERAIAIDLHDERFTTLVVEVADPEASIRDIERAIADRLGLLLPRYF